MPWVRFDDSMPDHRKIRDLTNAAFRLHISAICWCNRHLTDGRIDDNDLRHVSNVASPKKHAALLVTVGLWKPTETGWLIHDYLEYQFSAEKIRAERKAAAERQARARQAAKDTRHGSSHAVTHAGSHGPPTPHPPQPQKNYPDDSVESSDRKTWADHLPPSVTALRPKPQREGSWDEPDQGWADPGDGKW